MRKYKLKELRDLVRHGESTYTRCFPSATERDGFAAGLSRWCRVHTWENYYERRA